MSGQDKPYVRVYYSVVVQFIEQSGAGVDRKPPPGPAAT